MEFKFRKFQKGATRSHQGNLDTLCFGKYGIRALEATRFSAKGIETVRRTIRRSFKRTGQLWIRVFPNVAISRKPAEVRMGKGKGAPEGWVAVVRPGRILYGMQGVSKEVAKEAFRLAAHKLSVKTRFIERGEA